MNTNFRNRFCKMCFAIYTAPFFMLGFFAVNAAWGVVAGWKFGLDGVEEMLK